MRSTLGDYFWRHNGKEGYQKEVPDGFENVGRFWDVVGIKKTEFRTSVERAEYVEGRRVVRSLRTRVTRVSKTGTAMVQEAGCDHERSVRAERGQRCAGCATGAVDA
jgi:hypothetical protein